MKEFKKIDDVIKATKEETKKTIKQIDELMTDEELKIFRAKYEEFKTINNNNIILKNKLRDIQDMMKLFGITKEDLKDA